MLGKGVARKELKSELEETAIETLELENLCKTFEGFEIKNFSYRFVRGRQYALIGHNGFCITKGCNSSPQRNF